MSTKIYDAYRIKKSDVDNIFDLLNNLREDAIEYVSQDETLLKEIHVSAFYWLTLDEKEKDEDLTKKIERFQEDPTWTIKKFLKESEDSDYMRLPLKNIRLRVSIFMDDEYWYFKFFPGYEWGNKFLNEVVNNYKLEDFHYQNQTDPPEDIPYEEYKERDKKWDELTRGNNDYRDGMIYDVFDSHEFFKLVSRQFYEGKKTNKELFSHLTYHFEPLDIKKKDEN